MYFILKYNKKTYYCTMRVAVRSRRAGEENEEGGGSILVVRMMRGGGELFPALLYSA